MMHLDSFGFTWTHWDSLGLTQTHLDSLGFTWTHLDSLLVVAAFRKGTKEPTNSDFTTSAL